MIFVASRSAAEVKFFVRRLKGDTVVVIGVFWLMLNVNYCNRPNVWVSNIRPGQELRNFDFLDKVFDMGEVPTGFLAG